MALQSQGTPENPVSISFSQIEAEFGDGGSSRNIGKYRVSKTVGGMINLPLDDGIPQGDSSIAFSDFYGKQLNIIVSFDKNENRPPEAKTKYINNNEITVVGGFRDKPDNSSGSKVTLHVHPNKIIGSSKDSRTHCALRTGSGWAGTELVINIGKNALVSGAGGDGGNGGKPDGESEESEDVKAKGDPGQNGSSAIGIDYPVDRLIIKTDAIVQAGGGGGGGGGGAAGELGPGGDKSDERVGGAGGGGGQGVPAGSGGEAKVKEHKGNYRVEIQPQDGQDGSATEGGNGGAGGVNNESESGAAAQSGGGGGGGGTTPGQGGIDYRSIGGSGGDPATDGGSDTEEGDGGTGGDGDAEGTGQQEGPGGSRGLPGFAIVNSTGQGSLTIVESGTISGETISAQVN